MAVALREGPTPPFALHAPIFAVMARLARVILPQISVGLYGIFSLDHHAFFGVKAANSSSVLRGLRPLNFTMYLVVTKPNNCFHINLTGMRALLSLVTIVYLVSAQVFFAQQNGRPANVMSPTEQSSQRRKKEPRKEKAEPSLDQQQTLSILETLGEQAYKLDDSILKVRIMTRVADALWLFNESSSRRLFVRAFDAIDSIKLDASKDQRMRIAAATNAPGPLANLRAEVLQRIALHDYKFANSLRESMHEAGAGDTTDKTPQNEVSEKEELAWDIAIASANVQPERTAEFVRSRLSKGISEELGWALVSIRRNNQALAAQLFLEAVAVARGDLTATDSFENLALYVLPREEDAFGPLTSAEPEHRRTSRAFLSYVADRLASLSASAQLLATTGTQAQLEHRTLQSLLPLFQVLAPEKVPLVRERMDLLWSNMRAKQANAASPNPEDVDELLHEAESIVGSEKRDRRLMQVSAIAARQGELDQALAIAERISDEAERSIQVSLISYQAALRLVKNGELENAYRWAQRIEFLPQRIAAFNILAHGLAASKENVRARVVLEEISEWTYKTDNTPQKAKALLTLAVQMSAFDAERSFHLLASAVKTINSVDFSQPKSEPSRVLQLTLDMLDLDTVFTRFARMNMDRTLEAAQSLTHKEASLFAQVILYSQALQLKTGMGDSSHN